MRGKDQENNYTCCKGLLFYGGKQRSVGEQPRCLGYESPLLNVEVTEEDVVPPPPEDAKFIFVGIGMSIYNKEMLSHNKLPLVNGFSQLVMSAEPEEERDTQQRSEKSRRRIRQRGRQGQDPQEDSPVDGHLPLAGMDGHRTRSSGVQGMTRERPKSDRPRVLTADELETIAKQERDEVKQGARKRVEEILASARARVEKQYQTSVEIARIAPEKMRNAADVQATKAQEMPSLMVKTATRGVGAFVSTIRYISEKLTEEDSRSKK